MDNVTKERGILYSGSMVRAILEDRKTHTRRVCKLNASGRVGLYGKNWHIYDPEAINACPYGISGDRLWVRETWRVGAWDHNEHRIAVDYKADGHCRREWLKVDDDEYFDRIWEQTTEDVEAAGIEHDDEGIYHWEPGQSPARWRPSIFMPRWASRLTLEIVKVRVERLKDITAEDAVAEGITDYTEENEIWTYAKLWDSINGKKYPWSSNPWVWVVEFKRL